MPTGLPLSRDQAARILAYAEAYGHAHAIDRFDVCDRTIRNHKRLKGKDIEFAALVQEKKNELLRVTQEKRRELLQEWSVPAKCLLTQTLEFIGRSLEELDPSKIENVELALKIITVMGGTVLSKELQEEVMRETLDQDS